MFIDSYQHLCSMKKNGEQVDSQSGIYLTRIVKTTDSWKRVINARKLDGLKAL